jgi:hypothetical protein
VFKKFISIFISKFPDRFAYVVILIGIISMGTFAYETVGLPIQIASAEGVSGTDAATNAAVGWVYGQKCFGDRIKPETVRAMADPQGGSLYGVTIDFVSLEYKVDLESGGLHHIPVNHTVDMAVSNGKVLSAVEGFRDLVVAQASGPVTDVSTECL